MPLTFEVVPVELRNARPTHHYPARHQRREITNLIAGMTYRVRANNARRPGEIAKRARASVGSTLAKKGFTLRTRCTTEGVIIWAERRTPQIDISVTTPAGWPNPLPR